MMLSQLLPEMAIVQDTQVTGMSEDSRRLRAGEVFVARRGEKHDGRDYIQDAAKRASAILCEPPAPAYMLNVPVVEVDNLQARLGPIASRLYGCPSSQLRVIAVTGTNGKTSVTNYIAAAAMTAGIDAGVIGTLGMSSGGDFSDIGGMTTPDPITLQRCFSELLDARCRLAAVEASSHGLAQGRLLGTDVEIAVFTNLTRDHLDYHGDFEGYFMEKRRLFTWPGLKWAVTNLDDPSGLRMAGGVNNVLTYGCDPGADVVAESIRLHENGMEFVLRSPWGSSPVHSSLLGRFNIANLLATAATLGAMGVEFDRSVQALSALKNVVGRMDARSAEGRPTAVVDYAHTPDALAKSLAALREHCEGKLWCVFGCGGDRDRGKRSEMGSAAEAIADHLVITNDNPRSEDPERIAEDILRGLSPETPRDVILSRGEAIAHALSQAEGGDVVLIAGKGHETYQDVAGSRLPFSDFDVVEQCFHGG